MNDKRLIDANALLKKIAHHTVHDSLKHITFEAANTYEQVKGDMFSIVQKAPTIDAVKVVRCRECMFSKKFMTGNLYCELHNSYVFGVHPDGFCYRGAKMDGGAEC